MSDRETPKTPEVVTGLASRLERGDLERASPLDGSVWGAKHKLRVTEANTKTVEATTALGQALLNLDEVKAQLYHIDDIRDANAAERKRRKVELENKLRQAEREAEAAKEIDRIEKLKRELELAELEARLSQAKAPPRPQTEADKVRADFESRFGREAAIRAEAQRRIEEVLARSGYEVTPEAALEIKNINDYAQRKIDSLP